MSKIRLKTLPWILGLALIAVGLVAANRLTHTQDSAGGSGGAKPAARPDATPTVSGLTVLGTVDAPSGVARVDAPALPALSGMTVKDVLVKNGDVVHMNKTVLIQFDDSLFVEKVNQAKAELLAAQSELELTQLQIDDQPQLMKLQQLAVETAEKTYRHALETLTRGKEMFERSLATEATPDFKQLTEQEKERRRRENLDLFKGEGAVQSYKSAWEKEKIELERLEKKPVSIEKARVEAKIKRLEATQREAQAAVDACKLMARVDGIVEQISAVKGMTFGPTTRTPALYIVPAGKRIVWAEVEAEFAHKIADRLHQKVTIYDSHNYEQAYEGVVTRIGTSFLPKRGSADSLTASNTRVLECEIEVTDPAPTGKSPLRVGQPVRVVFRAMITGIQAGKQ